MFRAKGLIEPYDIGSFGTFLVFSGFEKIIVRVTKHFTLSTGGIHQGVPVEPTIQKCIGAFLLHHKKVWNGSPPAVEVAGWSPIKP